MERRRLGAVTCATFCCKGGLISLKGAVRRPPMGHLADLTWTIAAAKFLMGEFMSYFKHLLTLGACAGLAAFGSPVSKAQEVKKVFVIAMENHNWTQPANQFTGGIQQISQNPVQPHDSGNHHFGARA